MTFLVNPYWFVTGEAPPSEEAFQNYYSVDFDGTNDYVNIGDVLDQDGTSAFSMSFWVNLDTLAGHIVGKMLDSGTYAGYAAYINGNKLRFAIINSWSGNALAVDTVDDFATGSWKHVVVTYDGGQDVSDVKIYINGSSQTLTTIHNTLSSSSTTTAPFTIGARNGGALYLNGKTDEVAIFDSELSASDVTAIYNSGSPDSLASQSNLKGWWRMGDGANYPIIKNQAHFSQTATDYDGTDDYVDLGDSDTFSFGDGSTDSAFSISAWIYREGTLASHDGIVCKDATSNREWALYIYSGKMRLVLFDNSAGYRGRGYNAVQIPINTWHHVVATYNGNSSTTGIKLYLNGTQVDDANISSGAYTAMENTTAAAMIGKKEIDPLYFDGKIDDVLITSTELSSSDVTDIYNSGYPKDESERSGLLTYYKFDGDVYPVVRDETEFSNASLDFDGTDDYVDLGNVHAFEYNNAFSLSCWVKHDYTTNRTYIGKIDNSPNTGQGYYIGTVTGSKLRFWIANNYWGTKYMQVDGGTTITGSVWHHVVATYDGSGNRSGMKIYLNGAAETLTDAGATSLSDTMVSTEPLTIGAQAGANYMSGHIDDVIIFDSELSASDVTDIYNSGKPKDESSTSNVVGYYKMGDNTISPNVPSALGYGTHSVEFDGVNDFISVPHSTSLNITGAISISSWLKWDGGTQEMLVSKEGFPVSGDFKRGWALWAEGYGGDTGVTFTIWSSATAYTVDVGSNLTSGAWSHVVAVFEPSTSLKIYVNGSLAGTNTTSIPATMDSTTADVTIGRFTPAYGTGYLFGGNIKDMAIFNTNLSASDVTALYNSGLPKDLSSESDLVSYWRMGDGEDKYPNILDYKGTNHGIMTNMASDDITTDNIGSGTMTNMASDDIVADSPAGTSGQMTNMASDDFVAAKGAGTMTNMTDTDITTTTP